MGLGWNPGSGTTWLWSWGQPSVSEQFPHQENGDDQSPALKGLSRKIKGDNTPESFMHPAIGSPWLMFALNVVMLFQAPFQSTPFEKPSLLRVVST